MRSASREPLRRAALGVALALGACGGDLAPGTLRATPLPPPDVDPADGFAGRVRLEGRTDATHALVFLEVLTGGGVDLRREIGRLALDLPATLTVATETTEGAGSLRVELEPERGPLASFAAELPAEFPARGPGVSSPSTLRAPLERPDDAYLAVFAVRRGGTLSFTGPEGPFASGETVLRVVLRAEPASPR